MSVGHRKSPLERLTVESIYNTIISVSLLLFYKYRTLRRSSVWSQLKFAFAVRIHMYFDRRSIARFTRRKSFTFSGSGWVDCGDHCRGRRRISCPARSASLPRTRSRSCLLASRHGTCGRRFTFSTSHTCSTRREWGGRLVRWRHQHCMNIVWTPQKGQLFYRNIIDIISR